jgi:solute carrier family 25 oxoglutarate transporter 11
MSSSSSKEPIKQLNVVAIAAEPFVVGGAAAMLASSCIHPIDLAKVRLQLYAVNNPGQPKPSISTMLGTMVRNDGIKSVYAGLSAALMRQAVYGTARIGLHRKFSNELQERNGGKPLTFLTKTLSGMASGSIAVCIGTPFDVSLVRMQSDSMKPAAERKSYTHVFNAISRIAKEEGVGKLYSGLVPNVLRGMAMNVGMLACYDQAKEVVATYVTKESLTQPPSLTTQVLSSLIAGVTTSVCSLPFDLLKSRLQDGAKYKGVIDAAQKVLLLEGPLAFWTGLGAYYLRCAPHAMIVLLAQEPIGQLYKKAFYKA